VKLVVALLEDDHIANTTGASGKVRPDLLDVLFDLRARAEGIAIEDSRLGLLPVIGQGCELQEGVEGEGRFRCRQRRRQEILASNQR
jgi:hypothetical protein